MRRARMRSLRTYLLVVGVLLGASCGGAGPIGSAPTADPFAGQYIVNGGGGALDNVKALTDAFGKMHPTITWQGLAHIGSDARVNLADSGENRLGYHSRHLKDPEKGTV